MSIYTLGIEIGSTASKCVMLADGKEIVAKSLISVGAGTSGPQRAIDEVLESAGKKREEMAFVLATGYGRNSLMNYADKQMSELSCHAKGAHFLFPEVHTVIDIGGQDVKVLQIEDGIMTNFAMNDKCAAGTGRFLDVWAPCPPNMWASAPPAPSLPRAKSSVSCPWALTSVTSSTESTNP